MSQTDPSINQDFIVEEALNSIRKVIRLNLETGLDSSNGNVLEDASTADALKLPSTEGQTVNDVLLLTEYLQEDGSIQSFKDRITETQMSQEIQEEQPLQLSEEITSEEQIDQASLKEDRKPEDAFADIQIEKANVTDKQQMPDRQDTAPEDLISDKTMAESAAAFSELAHVARAATTMQSQNKRADVSPQTTGNYTVDALMRELLRPMLKEWLDAHLPSLVKWLVTEQIEKMLQAQLATQQGKATKTPAVKAQDKMASSEGADAEQA